MKKVSVIVPVYNVEKYIQECLDSLINQTYKFLQIILIDDGSTDNSGKICDEYAKKDLRVSAIHQKNGGAASAKNTGLRFARGEYIAFVDSDDYLELDAFEHMINILEDNHFDIVQCGYRDVFVNEKLDHPKTDEVLGTYSSEEYLMRYTYDWTCGLLWDKLYRRELFDDIFFEEGHVVDDEYFTYQGVMNAKKIMIDSKIVYNYRKRKSSVSYLPEHMERIIYDRLDYLYKRKQNVLSKFPSLTLTFNLHYINTLIWLSTDPYITENSLNEIKNQFKSFLKQNCVGIDFKLKLKVKSIIYTKNEKLLDKKRKPTDIGLVDNFFA